MEARYAIRQARTDELEALQAIEVEAATLFEDTRHADAVQGDATTLADFAEAQRRGQLWVATT